MKKQLFVLHHAGGSAYNMAQLRDNIKPDINICFLELPGRGKRIREGLVTDIDVVVDDLFHKMKPLLTECDDYYIFGHSMGALLGYLLAHKMIIANQKFPTYLFVSGTGGPSKPEKEKISILPRAEFKLKLKEYGGSPDDMLDNDDLMDFFEPILRADFRIVEAYSHKVKEKLCVPIMGFFGSEETTSLEEMKLWQEETNFEVEIFEFQGNHFFIYDNWPNIANILNKIITN